MDNTTLDHRVAKVMQYLAQSPEVLQELKSTALADASKAVRRNLHKRGHFLTVDQSLSLTQLILEQ